jgi:hypothetical protein
MCWQAISYPAKDKTPMSTQHEDSDSDIVINEEKSWEWMDKNAPATTVTLLDRQRGILHTICTLANEIDGLLEAAGNGQVDADADDSLASFLHDAETIRRILAVIGPLMSGCTLLTSELIARQAASL